MFDCASDLCHWKLSRNNEVFNFCIFGMLGSMILYSISDSPSVDSAPASTSPSAWGTARCLSVGAGTAECSPSRDPHTPAWAGHRDEPTSCVNTCSPQPATGRSEDWGLFQWDNSLGDAVVSLCVMFKHTLQIKFMSTSYEIALRWMPQHTCQHWFRSWLDAVRQQANIWANADPDQCHHMALLGQNELTHKSLMMAHGIIDLYLHK